MSCRLPFSCRYVVNRLHIWRVIWAKIQKHDAGIERTILEPSHEGKNDQRKHVKARDGGERYLLARILLLFVLFNWIRVRTCLFALFTFVVRAQRRPLVFREQHVVCTVSGTYARTVFTPMWVVWRVRACHSARAQSCKNVHALVFSVLFFTFFLKTTNHMQDPE